MAETVKEFTSKINKITPPSFFAHLQVDPEIPLDYAISPLKHKALTDQSNSSRVQYSTWANTVSATWSQSSEVISLPLLEPP